MEKPESPSEHDLEILATLINRLLDEGGEELYRRCVKKHSTPLDAAQVRELAMQNKPDSPNAPRPSPALSTSRKRLKRVANRLKAK